MNFRKHSELEGQHAFLSPSQYHWINYDDEKIEDTYYNKVIAVKRGTKLHEYAASSIELGQKLPSRPQKTLSMYVNDAIGYKMQPEQKLVYSGNCFGTADAISFRNNILRIHDLKTGMIPAHMEQLMIYAALFCLEYGIKPGEIEIQLQIYQNNDIVGYIPEVEQIAHICDRIVSADKIINRVNEREGLL